MNFSKGTVKDFYLLSTEVENIFVNEYMPGAPGDFVKVYLYGLLYAQTGAEMTHQGMARQLHMTEENLVKAWDYWASMGVVKKVGNGQDGPFNFNIEFVNLRDLMYGNFSAGTEGRQEAEPVTDQRLFDTAGKELMHAIEQITGKILSSEEVKSLYDWKQNLGATEEIIEAAFTYCYEKQKTSFRYVEKVVMEWASQGLKTREDVAERLETVGERHSNYKRVLRSLGMNRGATEAEKRMMDTWFDELNFNLERVLEACDRTISTTNPNLHYVNKVLENWASEAKVRGLDVNQKVTVTQAVLNRYYEFLREEAEKQAQERKQRIYETLPRIAEIDESRRELGSKLSRGLLMGMKPEEREDLKRLMNLLEEERAVLLTEHNFPVDFTDIKYSCETCGDTGLDENGNRCSCAKQRIGEAELWQKTNS